jgi:hypothetical protein
MSVRCSECQCNLTDPFYMEEELCDHCFQIRTNEGSWDTNELDDGELDEEEKEWLSSNAEEYYPDSLDSEEWDDESGEEEPEV